MVGAGVRAWPAPVKTSAELGPSQPDWRAGADWMRRFAMKPLIISVQVLVASFLLTAGANASPAAADEASAAVAAFDSERKSLGVASFSLALEDNVAALKAGAALEAEREFAARHLARLNAVDAATLPVCARIDLEKARFEAGMALRRARIAERPGLRDVLKAGLGASAEGREFYDLLLDWQIGEEVDPEKILAFGERQVKRANRRYAALQKKIGFPGDDAGLAAHLRSDAFSTRDAAFLQRTFEAADKSVRERLADLFNDYQIAPVKIARAERGGPLAQTPGFYDGASGTFFYNVAGDTYDLRNRDWLYLHEALPGHHFQNAIGALPGACVSSLPDLWSPAFVEGWGAYVETLGGRLGLYETPEAELAAVEWDMVRSARVVIDVGMNYRGWSDAEALAYWRKAVRGQEAIAQREIDRMRRWPAQVVTYKYGAARFEEARNRLEKSAGKDFDERAFHDLVLGRGPMPFPVFSSLVENAFVGGGAAAPVGPPNRGVVPQ
jgi:uncharacterized protein (DUF885 family)